MFPPKYRFAFRRRLAASAFLLLASAFTPNRLLAVAPSSDETAAARPQNVLVVAPPTFDAALRRWIDFREKQGYSVSVLPLAAVENNSIDFGIQTEPIATPAEIRAKIQEFARENPLSAILLVGDGAPTVDAKFGWRDVVPAPRQDALVVQLFGSERELATDSFYSDLDEDGVPDVPIGRLPVETPDELTAVVDKIIRYETASPVGNWTRRINIVAGPNGLDLSVVGSEPGSIPPSGPNPFSGVSAIVDSVVDRTARQLFAEYLPQSFATTLTQFSLKSPFCPYPPEFGNVFLRRANEGSLFLVYLGHGRVFGLDRFQTASGGDYGIFEIDDCPALDSPQTAPIALFFACYTGAYDANYRSLAEEVALSPTGPVAAIGASRRTAPYGMIVFGASLLETAFGPVDAAPETLETPETLGEILLQAQRKTLEPPPSPQDNVEPDADFSDEIQFNDEKTPNAAEPENSGALDALRTANSNAASRLDRLNARLARDLSKAEARKKSQSFRKTVDQAAAIFDPTAGRLPDQLADHVALFNLFGDPLLRVKIPRRISVEAPEIAYSSKKIPVEIEIPEISPKNAANPQREIVYQAELVLADYRSPIEKPKRDRNFVESAAARDEFRATYRAANRFVVDAVRGSSATNRFSTEILVPADFSGECVVRVAATDGERYFIGARRVLVRPFRYRAAALEENEPPAPEIEFE